MGCEQVTTTITTVEENEDTFAVDIDEGGRTGVGELYGDEPAAGCRQDPGDSLPVNLATAVYDEVRAPSAETGVPPGGRRRTSAVHGRLWRRYYGYLPCESRSE